MEFSNLNGYDVKDKTAREEIGNLNDSITSINENINSTINASITSINANINNIDSKVNQNKSDITLLNGRIDTANDDISALNSIVVQNTDDVNLLNSRVNNFSKLTSGSTTGDAELIDIRIGENGITYTSAGDAVRCQFQELKNTLIDKSIFTIMDENYKKLTVTKGKVVNADGSVSDSGGYDLYSLVADRNMSIYVPDNAYPSYIPYYFAIRYDNKRYRFYGSENYLPTKDNPLYVTKGTTVQFNCPVGDNRFKIYANYENFMSNDFKFNESHKEQIKDISAEALNTLSISGVEQSVKKDNDNIYVKVGNTLYRIIHQIDNDINLNTWRIIKASIIDDDSIEQILWNGSDADGVVKLKNEEDFVGGLHGDELFTSMTILMDGSIVDNNTTFAYKDFKTLDIFITSNVYHCSTSANKNTIAFVRNKKISFRNGKLYVANSYKASKNVDVVYAHLGMLSVNKNYSSGSLIKGYTVNSDYKYHGVEGMSSNTRMNEVRVYTPLGEIYFKTDKGSKQQYRGFVQDYNEDARLKWYFSQIYATDENPYSLVSGEEIYSEYELEIN